GTEDHEIDSFVANFSTDDERLTFVPENDQGAGEKSQERRRKGGERSIADRAVRGQPTSAIKHPSVFRPTRVILPCASSAPGLRRAVALVAVHRCTLFTPSDVSDFCFQWRYWRYYPKSRRQASHMCLRCGSSSPHQVVRIPLA
ncbi:unnamed protein product, partial [Scytosiphon promiscuus]